MFGRAARRFEWPERTVSAFAWLVLAALAPASAVSSQARPATRSAPADPPAEFLTALAARAELGYRINDKLPPEGWIARRPCRAPEPDCTRYFVCRGLKASYMSSLVPDEAAWSKQPRSHRHWRSIAWLWSWTYDSHESALLALKSLAYFNAVGVYGSPYHNEARLLFLEQGRVLILLGHDGDGKALTLTAERIRRALKSEATAAIQETTRKAQYGRWYGLPGSAPRVESFPASRLDALLNLSVKDDELAALIERLLRAGALDGRVGDKLNTRGMRLYERGDYAGATQSFEWANQLTGTHPKAAFNRAALAGRAGDALGAVYWLWRLRFMHIEDYIPGSEETEALTAKSRRDPDFDPVRRMPEYRAFESCIPQPGALDFKPGTSLEL